MRGRITSGTRDYRFNNKGEIYYENWAPSGSWLFLGAVRYNNFGHEVEHCSFEELKNLNGQWRCSNGKQKWHLIDLDHGTKRVWMNPSHTVTVED